VEIKRFFVLVNDVIDVLERTLVNHSYCQYTIYNDTRYTTFD